MKSLVSLLLAHFTGDMHQPLHVGCGYFAYRGVKEDIAVRISALSCYAETEFRELLRY